MTDAGHPQPRVEQPERPGDTPIGGGNRAWQTIERKASEMVAADAAGTLTFAEAVGEVVRPEPALYRAYVTGEAPAPPSTRPTALAATQLSKQFREAVTEEARAQRQRRPGLAPEEAVQIIMSYPETRAFLEITRQRTGLSVVG